MSIIPENQKLRSSKASTLTSQTLAALISCYVAMPTSASNLLIEEIVVTAQKRSESLQDVALSVSAFSGEQMDQLGWDNASDVANQVPGFNWSNQFANASPQIFLRGVGNLTFNPNSASPVSVYADGVVQGSNLSQGFSIFDLERIEVLKGPQGTLYGRNTTAGLVNFITRKPEVQGDSNGYIKVNAGSYSQLDIEAAYGAPLGEQAAFRVSALQKKRNSWSDNKPEQAQYNTGLLPIPSFAQPEENDVSDGEIDMLSLRAQFALEPSEDISMLLNIHGGKDKSHRPNSKLVGLYDYNNPVANPAAPPAFLFPCKNPGSGGNCSDLFGFSDNDDSEESFVNRASPDEIETLGTSITVDWEIDGITLTSQTAYEENERFGISDNDRSPNDSLVSYQVSEFEQYSQELRLTSFADEEFRWMIGAYYYQDQLDSYFGYATGPYGAVLGFSLLTGAVGVQDGIAQSFVQDTTTYGLFVNTDYDITDNLTLSLGLRWTYDEREVDARVFSFDVTSLDHDYISVEEAESNILFDTIPQQTIKDDWSEISGRATLDYQLTDDVKLYASYSRGFKGGEYNGGASSMLDFGMTAPEFLTAYEIGMKSDLWDGRGRLNASAFFYDIEDQQVFVVPTGQNIQQLTNAGESEVKGVEAEFLLMPTESLALSFGLTWLDSSYVSFDSGFESFTGNDTPQSPEWSFSGLARYTIDTPLGELGVQTDFSYTDDVYFSPSNNELEQQESYWLVNASADLALNDSDITLRAWVDNVTNEEYFTTSISLPVFTRMFTGMPRTYGVSVDWNF